MPTPVAPPSGLKRLIIHADDAGLSHSQNRATIQVLEHGVATSYSLMVPCPWFLEMAEYALVHPDSDYGIHLTLTCEWQTYRFGPVAPLAEVSSLVDERGHFFKKRAQLRERARIKEVERELDAQIQRALALGLRPSHLDSHMYSVGAREDFLEVYQNLGRKYGLPVLIDPQLIEMAGLENSENTLPPVAVVVDRCFYGDMPVFSAERLRAYYDSILPELVDGLNVLLIHPAYDDEEMRGVTVNHPNFGAGWRQVDLDYFTSPTIKNELDRRGVKLVTWAEAAAGSR